MNDKVRPDACRDVESGTYQTDAPDKNLRTDDQCTENQSTEQLIETIKSLRERNKQLEVLVGELKEYTATITHDLRAPLSAMKGFVEILVDLYSSSLDERGLHLLDRISFNAQHLDKIIRGLRELILLGEETQSRESVDPSVIARAVMDNRESEISGKGIRLEIQQGLPLLKANSARIYMLLDNLLFNSFKYAETKAQPMVRLGGYQDEGTFVWYVEDNGPGVLPHCQEKIFEVFFQCDKTRPGLGLGLSIVKRVVQLYGGKVWVERSSLGGAKFCFTLPGAYMDQAIEHEKPKHADGIGSGGKSNT